MIPLIPATLTFPTLVLCAILIGSSVYCGLKTWDDFRNGRLWLAVFGAVCSLYLVVSGVWTTYSAIAIMFFPPGTYLVR